MAVGDAALDRRRRADGGGRPLDQHGGARPADPGLPGLRGALPLPRPQPAALAELPRRLRDLAADPAAPDRLLLRPRPRARHARGPQPLRRRLARRRPQPAPDEEAARPPGRDRADPRPRRPAGARVPAPVRDLAGRGRARRPPRDPALRRRPEARVARDEDGQPTGLRGRGRAACARLRRGRRARRLAGAVRPAQPDGDRQARPRGQRPRQRTRRRPARARGGQARPRADTRGHRGGRPATTSRRSPTRAGSSRSGSRARTSAARARSCGSARRARSTSSPPTTRCSAARTGRRTSAAASPPTRSTRRRSRSRR